jgi:hypothetical protein
MCASLDYVHFGPRPLFVKVLHQQTKVETFEACLHAHMAGKRKRPAHFDCLQTAGPPLLTNQKGTAALPAPFALFAV